MYEDNFILQEYIDDLGTCDELIDFFEKSANKEPGKINRGVVKEVKDSTDVGIECDGSYIVLKYTKQLQNVLNSYIDKFPYCNNYSAFAINEKINIQHYAPNQGYYGWHTERTNTDLIGSTRHLVFMTYLNDVTDGGETEFFHQQLKIQPRKGLTLIWPADWTYTHRGITSPTQDKYIITGWFNYVNVVFNQQNQISGAGILLA